MRKIPTHLLYLQHFDHKADENRMADEYDAVEMMQINQGNHIPQCGDLLHSLQTHFCMQHLVKNVSVCSPTSALLVQLLPSDALRGDALVLGSNFSSLFYDS